MPTILHLLWMAAWAAKPDPLAPAPHAGCPAVDAQAGVVEHRLRVEWHLNPGAPARDLQNVEMTLATPTGGLHLAPAGDVSLKGAERSEVLRGDDGCARTATVKSALKGKDRDGVDLSLRTTSEVGLVLVTVRFQDGDAATVQLELDTPTRAVVQGDLVEVLVQLTPVDVEVSRP